ncbi:hypothetical protein JOB18_046182 [Solea senegalensis]|uniref:Uncharacterized protein n=1 Tax=Solea senegalensis TaxID=28829 RepID=A0AAV6PB60_SOLSE|nr:hypothetical protein JOB18_046182 [Solea senegalensis]
MPGVITSCRYVISSRRYVITLRRNITPLGLAAGSSERSTPGKCLQEEPTTGAADHTIRRPSLNESWNWPGDGEKYKSIVKFEDPWKPPLLWSGW